MSEKKDGGPAFPHKERTPAEITYSRTDTRGMTLRDYFAGQALAGMMAAVNCDIPPDKALDPEPIARDAYRMADAMIAQRETA